MHTPPMVFKPFLHPENPGLVHSRLFYGASFVALLHSWTSRLEDPVALWPPGFGVGSLSPGVWHWELGEAAGS